MQNIQQIPLSKSIDVSPDQFRNLHRFVESGEVYPPLNAAGEVEYNDVVVFLEKLARVSNGEFMKRNISVTMIHKHLLLLISSGMLTFFINGCRDMV